MTQGQNRRLAWSLVMFLGLGVVSQVAAQGAPPAGTYRLIVLSPKDGAVVKGPKVHVVLKAKGTLAGHTARHHLFLDTDLTVADGALPSGVRGIVHLGPQQHEYTFPAVGRGPHRLIIVLADPGKWGTTPLAADTVHFTVK